MSSSLQNIPNGISIYHSTSPSSGNNVLQRNSRFPPQSQPASYGLYETKSSSNINQKSLSPVMRGSPPTTMNNNSYQNAIYVQKQQFYGKSRGGLSADSPYGSVTQQASAATHNKLTHHNALTSSETNLSKHHIDRIHSSDESVCSSSSRDLNVSSSQPSTHHLYQTYGSTSGSSKQLNNWNDYQPIKPLPQHQPIYNDVMSSQSTNNNGSGFIPKKQQRGHKDKDEIVKAKPYNIQQNW